ncbi:MAG: imidazole glycerol phosphate synthase subunit HisH [Clostridium sp.]|nr:imidazole glycerol phosphate synthase subunit HisH [Ruminococcus flavefaciens]MCM1500740.1 imidazole glycerol phosphate synthase subunit HisH [Clostridium sp.]MCM1559171.1 imidazole glycerol phosphate synthase subunit HisH [Butyrivibrio sp.]
MIAIVDYGLGNLGSIANMLKAIGEKPLITYDPAKIEAADKIILPGVGAFDAGMKNLEERNLIDFLRAKAEEGKPILGICLGMQLLGRRSEEGSRDGLGLIPFDNVRFHIPAGCSLKVPHMGWDIVTFRQKKPLLEDIEGQQRYYFVHSYHAQCDSEDNILMTCEYGYEFCAAVVKDTIYGVQFHPEKSHDFGLRLLENFARRC